MQVSLKGHQTLNSKRLWQKQPAYRLQDVHSDTSYLSWILSLLLYLQACHFGLSAVVVVM